MVLIDHTNLVNGRPNEYSVSMPVLKTGLSTYLGTESAAPAKKRVQ